MSSQKMGSLPTYQRKGKNQGRKEMDHNWKDCYWKDYDQKDLDKDKDLRDTKNDQHPDRNYKVHDQNRYVPLHDKVKGKY